MVRDTVAMDTLANFATVRMSILPGSPTAARLARFPASFTIHLAYSQCVYRIR
jgi:hypothetical protein